MDQPLVSIITPVFNGEEFLGECIESVRQQSYSNWEYLILNNCSEDDSLEIALAVAEADKRIRVVNYEEFVSAPENMNRGLELIAEASNYCKFVHADDWLYPRCIEQMVACGERFPSAGIIGSYRIRDDIVMPAGMNPKTELIPGKQAGRMSLLKGPYLLGSPSIHLFRSELVRCRKPFYDEDYLAVDVDVCLDLLRKWDFGFVHQIELFQRTHEKSVTSANAWYLPQYLNSLYLLDKYGAYFLEAGELRAARQAVLRLYYRELAKSAVQRDKPADFWDRQREGLARVGDTLKWQSLAGAVLRQLGKVALGRDTWRSRD